MNFIVRRLIAVLMTALGLTHASFAAGPVAPPELEPLGNFPQTVLNILTPDARLHPFQIWIADSTARREQGLMFIKKLPDNAGMLFVFDRPQRIQMWMKNTFIPLDMVFIDANGRINNIEVNATPLSLRIIDSQRPALAVLELAGGSTEKLGIRPGCVVQHPFFASVGGSR